MTSLCGKPIRFCSVLLLLVATAEAFSTPSRSNARLSQQFHMSVPNSLDVLTSGLASIVCLPRGVTVDNPKSNDSTRITKLYDVENSNPCREVRERITELDLVVEQVIPVAEGTKNKLPGNEAPILVATTMNDDEEEDEVTIQGTDAILAFLDESFATPSPPQEDDSIAQVKEQLKTAGLYLASFFRPGRGISVSPAAASKPEKPLVLYSYEGNQFCRLVREVLTELDIVYELRSAGKESPRRAELASITGGSSQCPYLIDPNTGTKMPESADIVDYLYKTYGSYSPPSELLEWTSNNIMSLAKPIFKFLAPLQAGEKDAEIDYKGKLQAAKNAIEEETKSAPVVAYTYELSPFSSETIALLNRLGVDFQEISLGKEWLPGLIAEDGAIKRAALLEMTGQSSLPHIFLNGKPIGGLFSGSPGLVPMLQKGEFKVEDPVVVVEDPVPVVEEPAVVVEKPTPAAEEPVAVEEPAAEPEAKVEEPATVEEEESTVDEPKAEEVEDPTPVEEEEPAAVEPKAEAAETATTVEEDADTDEGEEPEAKVEEPEAKTEEPTDEAEEPEVKAEEPAAKPVSGISIDTTDAFQ